MQCNAKRERISNRMRVESGQITVVVDADQALKMEDGTLDDEF